MSDFDIIVIGGGINGLTTAAYLAKCGLSVAVVERRHVVGTHCSTEEVTIPGVRHNLHASAIMAGGSPVVEDLDLERFGLELLGGDWNFLHTFKDNRAFLAHSYNSNVTYKTIKRFSEKDARTYKKVTDSMNKYVDEILDYYYTPPSTAAEEKFGNAMKRISVIPPGIQEMDGYQAINELFEDEELRTALVSYELAIGPKARDKYIGAMGVYETMVETSGPLAAFTARGGSSNLPKSLARCILAHGGTILGSCEVEKIIISDGVATAVKLSDGSAYPSRILKARKGIVSNLTAVPTFLHLVGPDYLDPAAVKALRAFDYSGQTLFTVVYATDDVIRFGSEKWDPHVNDAYWFHYGVESIEEIRRYEKDLLECRITEPIVSVGGSFLFTLRDPTQAPKGLHNVTTWVNVPYSLADGGAQEWDAIRDEVGSKITDRLDEFAPGFKKSVRAEFSYTPLDIYRRNPSAIDANFCGGNLKVGQLYFDRPFPGCGAPRTPIKNLYISNSIFPQSGSHLPTGYIAAAVVAEDCGVRNQPWWTHRPLGWFKKWVRRWSGTDWNPFVTVA